MSIDKRHISASQISTWMRCRHLWAEQRKTPRGPEGGEDDSWAQRIGHFVHAVEAMFKVHPPEDRSETLWLSIPAYVGATWVGNGVPEELVAETRRRSKPILNQLWDKFGIDPTHYPTELETRHKLDLTPDCELWVVLDDVTLCDDKTLIIGEYKTSQMHDFDPVERTQMTIQPYVYQWAAKQLWPDYKPIAVQYTLATKGGAERVVRDLWPEDIGEWDTTLRRLPSEMGEGAIFRNLSHTSCKGCALWWSDCARKIKYGTGPIGETDGGYIREGDVADE